MAQRFDQQHAKRRHGQEHDRADREMMSAQLPPRRRECEQAKRTQDNDHGVETCALPVAAAEMQPHSKFIKGQRHAQAIDHRAKTSLRLVQWREEQDACDSRQKKNAIIEMMHMRPAQMEKEIGHFASHDQNHQCPRRDKCEEKRHKRQPRQMPQGICGTFRSARLHGSLLQLTDDELAALRSQSPTFSG